MKTVYFLIQGQFGNNLFQYFAAEFVKKLYGYDQVLPTFQINPEFNTLVNDEIFKEIITAHIQGGKAQLDTRKDILMMGFFQRSEIYQFERDFFRGLFNAENMNNISNRIKISNIVKYQTKHTIQPTENDLVLHLRCGDFWDHEKKQSQIFHPDSLKAIIKTIPYDKLYIVSSKPDFDWEKEYYKAFDDLNPVWVNGNLGDDFDFLLKAKKIITSASTMAWMGAFLGGANEVHIPYNTFYGGEAGSGQSLGGFNDTCRVYYSVDVYTPQCLSELVNP